MSVAPYILYAMVLHLKEQNTLRKAEAGHGHRYSVNGEVEKNVSHHRHLSEHAIFGSTSYSTLSLKVPYLPAVGSIILGYSVASAMRYCLRSFAYVSVEWVCLCLI